MKEIVSVHIGQAGVQAGGCSWEVLASEHQISLEGKPLVQHNSQQSNVFFREASCGQFIPRAVCIDSDPNIIDEVRKGILKNLLSPSYFLSYKEDSANIYIRGHQTIGKNMVKSSMDTIRKEAQKCEHLEGFFLHKSLGGGTGSGLGDLLLDRLSAQFGKTSKIGFNIHPSAHLSSSVVEPYNAVLSMQEIIQHEDVSISFDNQALYNICSRSLDVQNPHYFNLNGLIARILSSIAAPISFRGVFNTGLAELQTNLIPYPRIHFIMPSYSPFSSFCYDRYPRVQDLTRSVFSSMNQMINCDPKSGKYMICSLLYRGDIAHKDIFCAVSGIRNSKAVQFVDWCPTGFKVGLNSRPPVFLGQNPGRAIDCCLLSNNSSISQSFDEVCMKYDRLFGKRAFIHWYVGQGLDQDIFFQNVGKSQRLQKQTIRRQSYRLKMKRIRSEQVIMLRQEH